MRPLTVVARAVDAGEAISCEEAEALVRSQARTCRGQPVVPVSIQTLYFGKIVAGIAPQELFEEYIGAVGSTPDLGELGAPLRAFALARLVTRGGSHRDALIDALRAHQCDVGRPCGFDFNGIVLAVPFDGQERSYECPRCGVTGTFRSPLISTRSLIFVADRG